MLLALSRGDRGLRSRPSRQEAYQGGRGEPRRPSFFSGREMGYDALGQRILDVEALLDEILAMSVL